MYCLFWFQTCILTVVWALTPALTLCLYAAQGGLKKDLEQSACGHLYTGTHWSELIRNLCSLQPLLVRNALPHVGQKCRSVNLLKRTFLNGFIETWFEENLVTFGHVTTVKKVWPLWQFRLHICKYTLWTYTVWNFIKIGLHLLRKLLVQNFVRLLMHRSVYIIS